MWLAIILACSSASADSCEALVRTEEPFYNKEACWEDVNKVAIELAKAGIFTRAACMEIGKSL